MISIVIPVFNNQELTQQCIESIRENTENYELIIVDNGSTPPIEGATVRNPSNLGFPVAVNQGIRAAKSDVIILLNNDVIVTPEWAERLIKALDDYSIVAPMTNYCAGLQQITIPAYDDDEGLYKSSSLFAKEREGRFQEVNWVIGFCVAFRKSLYDEIGPFDESLWPCSGEELDFCLRARQAGHKVGIAQDVYVHHFGSQTFKAMMTDQGYKDLCVRNENHVSEKWGDFWNKQAIEEPKREAVTIGAHSYVDGEIDVLFTEDGATLTIGKFCSIAKGCKVILGGNHRTDWISAYPFPAVFPDSPEIPNYRTSKGDVTIGNDVWIGAGVTILSGVTIGDGTIIGAGSVVVKDIEPYSVTCGNSAVHKKFRFDVEDIERLLNLKWWNWPDDTIRGAIPFLMSGDIGKLVEYVAGVKA